jgi:hypothetical protein
MKKTVEFSPTPYELAEAFCEMSDEEQAQFFVECAAIAEATWSGEISQTHAIGRHLAKCHCATPEARKFVLEIAEGIGDA